MNVLDIVFAEKEDLYLAIRNFQKRERRFGLTEEQLKK